jgi:hypothetical protein
VTAGDGGSRRVEALTVGEGLRLAAQTFTRDVTLLSCCAS